MAAQREDIDANAVKAALIEELGATLGRAVG
jgi:hypothetical protein